MRRQLPDVSPNRPTPRRRPGRVSTALLLLVLTLLPGSRLGGAETGPPAGSTVNFSFDQVDVRTFVKLIGEMTGRTYVVDEGVKGQITVVTPPVPVRDVYPLFVAILESVGCSVVEAGGVVRVVALPPRAVPSAPVVGAGTPVPATGYLTKVVRLKHLGVAELRRVLEALVGREKAAAVSAVEATNHIIVTDTAENIRRVEQIIGELDQPGLGSTSEVIPLAHLDAAETAQQFSGALGRGAAGAAGGRAVRDLALFASPHSNSIVAIGSPLDIAELRRLLGQLDVPSPLGRGNLHVVFLKYLAADEAAKSLNALLEKSAAKEPQKSERRRVAIEASVANNALLVDAPPLDFAIIRGLVDELDQMPQQVLIEVVIAEVSLSEAMDVGVEMASLQMPSEPGSTVVQGSTRLGDVAADALMNAIQSGVFPRGITIGVAHGTSRDSAGNVVVGYPGLFSLNALARNGKVRILSSVPLLAQNNKEASVSVVNNIPVLKSTIQGGSGTARDVIQNIDRVDVGIKLKLTPHINPGGDVRMVLNPSIEAIIDQGATAAALTPTIARREVSTTVTVPTGQTIVLSGLIREDRRSGVRGIPILRAIPLVGVLFRRTVDETERTNLLVFVTPQVVAGASGGEAVTRSWSRRAGLEATNVVRRLTAPDAPAP